MTDWPALFFALSRWFGWTPQVVRRLTVDEAQVYTDQISDEVQRLGTTESRLTEIRDALFGLAGIRPEQPQDATDTIEKAGLPTFTITAAEKEAWLAAGMPDIGAFLTAYRRRGGQKNDGGRQAGSPPAGGP